MVNPYEINPFVTIPPSIVLADPRMKPVLDALTAHDAIIERLDDAKIEAELVEIEHRVDLDKERASIAARSEATLNGKRLPALFEVDESNYRRRLAEANALVDALTGRLDASKAALTELLVEHAPLAGEIASELLENTVDEARTAIARSEEMASLAESLDETRSFAAFAEGFAQVRRGRALYLGTAQEAAGQVSTRIDSADVRLTLMGGRALSTAQRVEKVATTSHTVLDAKGEPMRARARADAQSDALRGWNNPGE